MCVRSGVIVQHLVNERRHEVHEAKRDSAGRTTPRTQRIGTRPEEGEKQMKRLHLVLPEELYSELDQLAEERHTTVTGLLRSFIRLGLLAVRAEENSDQALIFRNGDREQQLLVL